MQLKHIKLRTGEDLVGSAEYLKDNSGEHAFVKVTAPISIHMDPTYGFYAKSWLLLSKDNVVILNINDVMFCKPASNTAEEYYTEFVYRHANESELDQRFDEVEEMFQSMVESKISTKH